MPCGSGETAVLQVERANSRRWGIYLKGAGSPISRMPQTTKGGLQPTHQPKFYSIPWQQQMDLQSCNKNIQRNQKPNRSTSKTWTQKHQQHNGLHAYSTIWRWKPKLLSRHSSRWKRSRRTNRQRMDIHSYDTTKYNDVQKTQMKITNNSLLFCIPSSVNLAVSLHSALHPAKP